MFTDILLSNWYLQTRKNQFWINYPLKDFDKEGNLQKINW